MPPTTLGTTTDYIVAFSVLLTSHLCRVVKFLVVMYFVVGDGCF